MIERKILKSVSNPAHVGIPFIRWEHHEIAPEVFQRKSVGSLSNCIACHRTAAMGESDENVSIPE